MPEKSKGNPDCETCEGSGILNNDAVDDCWCVDSKKKKVALEKKLVDLQLLEDYKSNLIKIKSPNNKGTFYSACLTEETGKIWKRLSKSSKKKATSFNETILNKDFIEEQILTKVTKLENVACDCLPGIGYNCDIHKEVQKIKDLLKLF